MFIDKKNAEQDRRFNEWLYAREKKTFRQRFLLEMAGMWPALIGIVLWATIVYYACVDLSGG